MTKRSLITDNDVFQGKKSKPLEFILPKIDGNRIIFAALFPPANASEYSQHANITSTNIKNRLGHDKFDWIDIYNKSPIEKAKHLHQPTLEKLLNDDSSYREIWIKRIFERVKDVESFGFTPIIYVCGGICTRQWKKSKESSLEKRVDITFELYKFENAIIFYGQHPSAYLMHHGKSETSDIFDRNMRIINFLFYENGYSSDILSVLALRQQRQILQARKVCQILFNQDCWPMETDEGKDPYRHLKTLNFNNEEICKRIVTVDDDLLRITSFCSNLSNDVFWECFRYYDHRFFVIPSFCKQIVDPDFQKCVKKMIGLIKVKNCVKLFGVSTFCSQISKEVFKKQFDLYFSIFDNDVKMITKLYSNANFCKSVYQDPFRKKMEDMMGLLKFKDNIISLFSNTTFCKKIESQIYWDFSKEIILILKDENHCDVTKLLLNLFSDDIDLDFKNILLGFFQPKIEEVEENKYPLTKKQCIYLFKNNCFLKQIRDLKIQPLFLITFNNMLLKYKSLALKLFQRQEICAQIINDQYRNDLERYIQIYPHFIDIMCSSEKFCQRFRDPKFIEIAECDFKEYGEIGFNMVYSNPIYVEFIGKGNTKHNLDGLIRTFFQNFDKIKLLKCTPFVNAAIFEIEKFYETIKIWKLKCEKSDYAFGNLFACESFCRRSSEKTFQNNFDFIVKFLEEQKYDTKMSNLTITMQLMSVSSFNTKEDNEQLYFLDLMVRQYSWERAFLLFKSGTFVARVAKKKYLQFMERFVVHGFKKDDVVQIFTNDAFNTHMFSVKTYRTSLILDPCFDMDLFFTKLNIENFDVTIFLNTFETV